jgi:hypothetical protein
VSNPIPFSLADGWKTRNPFVVSLFVLGSPVIERDTILGPQFVGPAVQFPAVDVVGSGRRPLESLLPCSHLVKFPECLEGSPTGGVVFIPLDDPSTVLPFCKSYPMGAFVHAHVHSWDTTGIRLPSAANLDLLDYLGTYGDGPTLGEFYGPASGLAESVLTDTEADSEFAKMRVTGARVERDGGVVCVLAVPYVKPADEAAYETDSRGYATLAPVPAMEFVGLDDAQADLIEAFVPYAVAAAGGFAGYRDNATATISPLDRLESLTLPELTDVEGGIERTDELIDEIVYELYGLTDEEIAIVEDAIGE